MDNIHIVIHVTTKHDGCLHGRSKEIARDLGLLVLPTFFSGSSRVGRCCGSLVERSVHSSLLHHDALEKSEELITLLQLFGHDSLVITSNLQESDRKNFCRWMLPTSDISRTNRSLEPLSPRLCDK